jgi:hypothetical protein
VVVRGVDHADRRGRRRWPLLRSPSRSPPGRAHCSAHSAVAVRVGAAGEREGGRLSLGNQPEEGRGHGGKRCVGGLKSALRRDGIGVGGLLRALRGALVLCHDGDPPESATGGSWSGLPLRHAQGQQTSRPRLPCADHHVVRGESAYGGPSTSRPFGVEGADGVAGQWGELPAGEAEGGTPAFTGGRVMLSTGRG